MDRRSLFYWSREFASGLDTATYKANEKMTFLSNDKEVLRLYNMREMAQIDYNSGIRKAKEDGIVEGRIERNIEIAWNMIADGVLLFRKKRVRP